MQQLIAFAQTNLILILAFSLVAVSFFALGLLSRRKHVVQILPAPVSPGLERAISAALSSREIVYVQPAVSPVAFAPVAQPEPAYAAPSTAERKALSKPEEIEHEIAQVVSKLEHAAHDALEAAARDALLAILAHMEHHSDDDWFKAMHDKIAHAKTNDDLRHCAEEMAKHVHGGH